MLRIFIGFDPRQPVAYNVLAHSIAINSSQPVQITPLILSQLPIKRQGLTQFTYSRYLVPWLCDYKGQALFVDADMVVDADIAELFKLAPEDCGVSVVKKEAKFEWPSLMLFNCEGCTRLTPEYIETQTPQHLEDWSLNAGELPLEWNYCVGYDHQDIKPKLVHYTAGLPVWQETKDCKHADLWRKYASQAFSTCAYDDLMRSSVHHKKVVSGEINY